MKNVLYVFLILSLLGGAQAIAKGTAEIGKITYIDKKYWALRIQGSSTRDAVVDGVIHEYDTIQTIAGQHLVILLEDGTELLVGPSTRMSFSNWTGRDNLDRRVRSIKLVTGMLKAKVRKIYSELEPFVVENPHGVIAVRGTEFVVEAGSGGRLDYARRLTPGETYTRRNEIEVHALEGEVYLAKTREALWSPDTRVTLAAGQTSLVRDSLPLPQRPHAFDVGVFRTYVAKAAPGVPFNVIANTTNQRRAERAENAKQEGLDAVSPAKPAYAKVHRPTQGRALASVPADDVMKAESERHSRRRALTPQEEVITREEKARRTGKTTSDGMSGALSGTVETDRGVDALEDARNARIIAPKTGGGEGYQFQGGPKIGTPAGPK
jgi:hypothetical protein